MTRAFPNSSVTESVLLFLFVVILRPESIRAQISFSGAEAISMSYVKLKKVADALNLSEVDKFYRSMRRAVGRRGSEISSYMTAWMAKHILGIPSEAQFAKKEGRVHELRTRMTAISRKVLA